MHLARTLGVDMARRKLRRRPRTQKRTVHLEIGLAPRKPSVIEQKAKAALLKFLEAAERDPGRVINGFVKLGETVDSARRFVRDNPEKAKATAGQLGLAFLASLARKGLTEKP